MPAKGTIRPDVAFHALTSNRKQKAKEKAEQAKVTTPETEETPKTIVESPESEVFAENASITPSEPSTVQPVIKPVKVSKRPYIATVESCLEAGSHTKKELLKLITDTFPEVSKGGASTFLTDLLNAKYRHWKDREVTKKADGRLQFSDKITADIIVEPAAEAPANPEPTEQPEE